jgi:hypothetical protein
MSEAERFFKLVVIATSVLQTVWLFFIMLAVTR